MEGALAIGAALECFPHFRLKSPDASVTYKGSYFLRGLRRLKWRSSDIAGLRAVALMRPRRMKTRVIV